MKTLAALLLLFLALSTPASASDSLSAARHPGESADAAAVRALREADAGPETFALDTVYKLRATLDKLDTSVIPQWTSPITLQSAFERIRDERFLEEPKRPGFPRRLSWLYPDDGCYARAELSALRLQGNGLPAPAKIFAFGKLKAKTPNHPKGVVRWWYHVVIGYRAEKEILVLDPAIETAGPLPIAEWAERMNGSLSTLKLSICDDAAYTPRAKCHGGAHHNEKSTLRTQYRFLKSEWKRVIALRESPDGVLGDKPPWIQRFPDLEPPSSGQSSL